MSISTHILDTSLGKPAEGVSVALIRVDEEGVSGIVASGVTNADGRIPALVPEGTIAERGHYRLVFDVAPYFAASGRTSFYPVIAVDFTVGNEPQHYHVPLLLNAFGYSTYRGS